MSDLALYTPSNLPAFLRGAKPIVTNELAANVGGGGFPVMSIKGKVWTMVKDGNREVLMNPNDPDEPATSINVVLVKANAGLSKIWYAKQFVEGTDAKPDCFSHDGVAPDPTVEKPQSSKCMTCAKNQWGSKISDDGKKMKACADSRRVGIANPDSIDDPILLRVPAASLKPLAEYGNDLAKRGIPYSACITKIGFDREAASPKLTFKHVGYVTDEQYAQVQETLASEQLANILGKAGEPVVVAEESHAEPAADTPAEAPAPKPAAKAAPKAKPAPVETPVVEAEPVAEKPAAKAAPAAKVVDVGGDLGAELDDLLGDM